MPLTKRTNETLDYSLDFSAELADKGDSAATATWTVPAGIVKTDDALEGGIATVWLSGGTAGTVYQLGCRLLTTAGRIYDRPLTVRVDRR